MRGTQSKTFGTMIVLRNGQQILKAVQLRGIAGIQQPQRLYRCHLNSARRNHPALLASPSKQIAVGKELRPGFSMKLVHTSAEGLHNKVAAPKKATSSAAIPKCPGLDSIDRPSAQVPADNAEEIHMWDFAQGICVIKSPQQTTSTSRIVHPRHSGRAAKSDNAATSSTKKPAALQPIGIAVAGHDEPSIL